MTLKIDDVNVLGQLETSVGGDGRSLDGDFVELVQEGV